MRTGEEETIVGEKGGGGRDPSPVIKPTGANATSFESVVEGEERLELEEKIVEVVEEEEGRDPCLVIKPAGANATKGEEEESRDKEEGKGAEEEGGEDNLSPHGVG